MSFLSKTLSEISHYIKEAFYSEKYAREKGLLQDIDPRIKILLILGFIILTVYVHSILLLIFLMGIAIFFSIMSSIPLRFYIPRVWLFIPVFTGIIAIPAMFNAITPGNRLLTVISFGSIDLYITDKGLWSATILILRVATSVSFAVLLSLTTRWNEIMDALLFFRISPVFVLILTLTYRYIFYLLEMMNRMLLSRRSRSGSKIGAINNWRLYAPLIGALFIKAHDTNEKVYLAMMSRGFTGEPSRRKISKPSIRSTIVFALSILIYSIILLAEHSG